ncbi:MAG: BrnT family toxin [Deltaproteobacteria bacterium]|nr:BrnT family toxin [Deltaproteobacteria bacterium]
MKFEWDPAKARANRIKHDVSFDEAAECFGDPLAIVDDDRRHPDRMVLIGESRSCRLVLTVFVDKHTEVIRIISARKATRRERRAYEEADV